MKTDARATRSVRPNWPLQLTSAVCPHATCFASPRPRGRAAHSACRIRRLRLRRAPGLPASNIIYLPRMPKARARIALRLPVNRREAATRSAEGTAPPCRGVTVRVTGRVGSVTRARLSRPRGRSGRRVSTM